jgi:hypothetical protein
MCPPDQGMAGVRRSDYCVSATRISELIHGQRPITADTELRLGVFSEWRLAFG